MQTELVSGRQARFSTCYACFTGSLVDCRGHRLGGTVAANSSVKFRASTMLRGWGWLLKYCRSCDGGVFELWLNWHAESKMDLMKICEDFFLLYIRIS